nr:hypothetical protein GCM10025730_13860 [Promicromonospora thailandica]
MLIQVRKTRRCGALLAATTCALLVVSGTAVAAVTPGTGPDLTDQAWSVDLATLTADDTGVRRAGDALRLAGATGAASAGGGGASPSAVTASGQLVAEPVTLDSPAGAVDAVVDDTVPAGTEVLVDVRGRLPGQGPDAWTEWVPAGSALPAPSGTVQARVTLVGRQDGGPAVRAVTLTPEAPRSRSLQDVEAAPTSGERAYRIFATREGLVGGTTANGHVITQRDHFVALPSRRGLSSAGSGSYSVRVCAESTGRCAYEPVWDVGPWNTTDDYWNPAGTRQSWADLPQGRPEAQAAYQDGYNGGLDGFGRRVANPAGIDLADGTFWDGLGLTDNAWTTVTYLWTGSGPGAWSAPAGARSPCGRGPAPGTPPSGRRATTRTW